MKEKKAYFITEPLEDLIHKLDDKAFFVGGCVRDYFLHTIIGDVDMATPLKPQEVIDRLKDTKIHVIPTGIEHGTLTLLLENNQKVEITSFRKDVQTNGRHAVVEFGQEITEDAVRRDLTINALYMDKNGKLMDFVGGLKDLKKKKVRFIGNAEQRIKEDALRILRFYRFYGLFLRAKPDKEAVVACRRNRSLLNNISEERIKEELLKILSQPYPYKVLHLMEQTGILRIIFKRTIHLQDIKHLFAQEKRAGVQASALFRCFILNEMMDLPFVLSRTEKKQIDLWKKANTEAFKTQQDYLKILFLYGKKTFADMVLFKKKKLNFRCFQYLSNLKEPVCPFNDSDIMKTFNLSGAKISKQYQKAVDIWIKKGFCKKDVVFKEFSE